MAKRLHFDPVSPASYLRAGESLKAALQKHDPFWGPQLIVARAVNILT
jgi:hypothetical protein